MCILHNYHCSTISQKDALASWDDTPEEPPSPMYFHDISSSFKGSLTCVFCLSLRLILEGFKWPNDPESHHRGAATGEELSPFSFEKISFSSKTIYTTKVKSHKPSRSRIKHSKSFIYILKLPLLPCLSSYLCIFKWALNKCS